MENASRALVMAASILIAIIIISALVLMFNNLNNYQKTNVQNEREAQVIEFNNQYETYNRTDVRGSDLYSLLNRAINYNTRKSSSGVGKEGEEIAFMPIEIKVDLGNDLQVYYFNNDNFDVDHLLVESTYSVSGMKNDFEEKVLRNIRSFENYYGQTILAKLATNPDEVIRQTTDTNEQKEIENKYRDLTGQKKDYSKIQDMKKAIYQYYEYIQFKRAHFDCVGDLVNSSGVEYDDKTGRITKMSFTYNKTIE